MRSIDERVADAPADKRDALRATLEAAERGRELLEGHSTFDVDPRTLRAMAAHRVETLADDTPTHVGKSRIVARRGSLHVVLADAPVTDVRDGFRVRRMGPARPQKRTATVAKRPPVSKPDRAPRGKQWHTEVLDAARNASVENWQDHYLATRQVMAHADASGNDRLKRHALTMMKLLRAKFGPVPTPPNARPARQDRAEEFRTVSGMRRVIFN
jgi:hypothetical protein